MEQLIARLDVAMFNAILRESSDEIPTDPVADPISDAKVLPIPPGKASFGAGAQLKSAVSVKYKIISCIQVTLSLITLLSFTLLHVKKGITCPRFVMHIKHPSSYEPKSA